MKRHYSEMYRYSNQIDLDIARALWERAFAAGSWWIIRPLGHRVDMNRRMDEYKAAIRTANGH